MLVVIDTNILVSALMSKNGAPARVVSMVLSERLTPCFDYRILLEYQEVLRRPKFGFTQGEINPLLDWIMTNDPARKIAFALAVLLIRGFDRRIYYMDALSVAGAVSILLGLLMLAASAGAFDTIGYGFSTLRSVRRDKDLYEYSLRKKEKRKGRGRAYLPLIAVGAVFLAGSFVMIPT